ncbi:MAG: 2-succinyl-5-enolpyruvyl-6-hydroxy-3-cyclohexene-1-carboxylic-acid synthase [Ginsengibacter sp.]
MKLSDKKSIQEIVLTLAGLGLKNVIISPGSRNAPLTISFNQHLQFKCISIRDERSAAFFALGMALELKEPVILLCTSGSATLNYAPAIVEAYYQRIPLFVITADRPPEWIGQQDGQSINQENIYKNYIRKSYTLDGETTDEEKLWYNMRCINEGFAIATQTDPGPVHFNVPLREPLYGLKEAEPFVPKILASDVTKKHFDESEMKELQNIFANSKKVMILAGQESPDTELKSLLVQLAKNSNTIVLCETTSNIHHPEFIEYIDRCLVSLNENEIKDFMPNLLITVGGAIVSKKIKAILRKNKPSQHWNIHPYDAYVDSYKSLTRPISMDANDFLKQFLQNLNTSSVSDYKSKWNQRASILEKKHQEFIGNLEYSDLYVFSKIYNKIPGDTNVHFSNSSPIRYAQLFDNSKLKYVHCNRGVSGIDGCTSTAMGAASSNPDQNYILITGDIAFFYDNNAFWNNQLPKNIKIILINNSGGGIFRIIDGPSDEKELEDFFETKHHISAKKLVEFYGLNYLSANEEKTLEQALDQFFNTQQKSTVLEVFTPNEVNPKVLASYFKYLAHHSEK